MRVIIIDPYIENLGGHSYAHADHSAQVFRKQGIDCSIIGGTRAEAVCNDIGSFVPGVDSIAKTLMSATSNPKKWLEVPGKARQACKSIDRVLFDDERSCAKAGDVIFVQTSVIQDHFLYAYVFHRRRKHIQANNIRILMNLCLPYIQISPLITKANAVLMRIMVALLKPLGSSVKLVTDSDVLRDDFQPFTRQPIPVLPIPMSVDERECQRYQQGTKNTPQRWKMAFAGSLRLNKGFDVFVRLVERLSKEPELFSKLDVYAQTYVQAQTKTNKEGSEKWLERLNELARQFPNIHLMDKPLSREDYVVLMSTSNIITLPYSVSHFRAGTSNVLIECVLYGAIPIVSKNTWLSHELSKNGFPDLCFDVTNLDEVCGTVRHVMNDYADLETKMTSFRKKWAAYHTGQTFVEEFKKLLG